MFVQSIANYLFSIYIVGNDFFCHCFLSILINEQPIFHYKIDAHYLAVDRNDSILDSNQSYCLELLESIPINLLTRKNLSIHSMVDQINPRLVNFPRDSFETYVTALASFCCCTATVSIQLPSLHKSNPQLFIFRETSWFHSGNKIRDSVLNCPFHSAVNFVGSQHSKCINPYQKFKSISRNRTVSARKLLFGYSAQRIQNKMIEKANGQHSDGRQKNSLMNSSSECASNGAKSMWYERCH